MKKLFGLFVIGILSSTAMAELVCLSPSGCAIEIETGACSTCVETSIVEPIVEPIVESIIKSEIVSTSKTTKPLQLPNGEWLDIPIDLYDDPPNSCPNYFERKHGSCEWKANGCIKGSESNALWLCYRNYERCKKLRDHYNEGWTKNNGKMRC